MKGGVIVHKDIMGRYIFLEGGIKRIIMICWNLILWLTRSPKWLLMPSWIISCRRAEEDTLHVWLELRWLFLEALTWNILMICTIFPYFNVGMALKSWSMLNRTILRLFSLRSWCLHIFWRKSTKINLNMIFKLSLRNPSFNILLS